MSHLSLRTGIVIALVAATAISSGAAFAAVSNKSMHLLVINHRHVPLEELHATAVGSPAAKTLVKGLAPGSSALVKLKRGKHCIFELHATYQDGSHTEFAHFDLCRDETLNLIE